MRTDLYDGMSDAVQNSEAILYSENCMKEIKYAADERVHLIVARLFDDPFEILLKLKREKGAAFLITAGRFTTELVKSRVLAHWPTPNADEDEIDLIRVNIPASRTAVISQIQKTCDLQNFEVKIKKLLLGGQLSNLTDERLRVLLQIQRQAKQDNPESPDQIELWIRVVDLIGPFQASTVTVLEIQESINTSSLLRINEPVNEFDTLKKLVIETNEDVENLFKTSNARISRLIESYEIGHLENTTLPPVFVKEDDFLLEDVVPITVESNASISSPLLQELLDWLSPVEFQSDLEKFRSMYIQGTRNWDLNAFHNWINDNKSSTLCQLGGAGVGKSMFAWLVYASAATIQTYTVGAHFFCKHNNERKNNPRNIVSTMACQLALQFPAFQNHLKTLKTEYEQKMVTNHDLVPLFDHPDSFKLMIVDGLYQITIPSGKTLLLIIDALDECGKQGDLNRQYLLTRIGKDCQMLPHNIRLFVTSRPESDIVTILEKLKTQEMRSREELNLLDIKVYVTEMFRRLCFDSTKPSHQSLIDRLVDASEGLFVFAALACKEISDVMVEEDLTPDHEKVGLLIDRLVNDGGGLDGIYLPIFQRVYNNAKEKDTFMLRSVIGVAINAKISLDSKVVAFILKIRSRDVQAELIKVRSLLFLDQGKITILHKSVKDFLISETRCVDSRFLIKTAIYHNMLCERALESLNSAGNRDIGPIEKLFLENYATDYWAFHLENGQLLSNVNLLQQFLSGNKPPLFGW
ncbi:hypothetical protein HK100_008173, partial [Physocladia obscura]